MGIKEAENYFPNINIESFLNEEDIIDFKKLILCYNKFNKTLSVSTLVRLLEGDVDIDIIDILVNCKLGEDSIEYVVKFYDEFEYIIVDHLAIYQILSPKRIRELTLNNKFLDPNFVLKYQIRLNEDEILLNDLRNYIYPYHKGSLTGEKYNPSLNWVIKGDWIRCFGFVDKSINRFKIYSIHSILEIDERLDYGKEIYEVILNKNDLITNQTSFKYKVIRKYIIGKDSLYKRKPYSNE